MKTKLHLVVTILAGITLFSSCKSTEAITQTVPQKDETTVLSDPLKARIDRFVSIDAISELRTGMSIEEVSSKLAAKPYNVFSAQADGHHIIQYKYRLTQIEVNAEEVNNYGIEKRNNKTFYTPGAEDLYLMFNGLGKLEYFVTSKGSINEKLLRENNLLYVIKKDKDKFINDTSKLYRLTNSNVFYPMIPCSDCDTKKETKPAVDEKNTIRLKIEPSGKN